MKVCEVCGQEEELETGENMHVQTGLLHICENCRNDRKYHSYDDEK